MSSDERRDRGRRAKELLDDPLLREAFAKAEQGYVTAWKAGRTTEDRELAHHHLKALEHVRAHLTSFFLGGEIPMNDKIKI